MNESLKGFEGQGAEGGAYESLANDVWKARVRRAAGAGRGHWRWPMGRGLAAPLATRSRVRLHATLVKTDRRGTAGGTK